MSTNTPSKKADNRKTINHDKFKELVASGVPAATALKRCGGDGKAETNASYANRLKNKYAEEIKAIAVANAGEGLYGLSKLSKISVETIENTLADETVKPLDKARLAKDVLSLVQSFIPKETKHTHTHTHDISYEEAQTAAKDLLAEWQERGGVVGIIDADVDEQSRTGEDASEGTEAE